MKHTRNFNVSIIDTPDYVITKHYVNEVKMPVYSGLKAIRGTSPNRLKSLLSSQKRTKDAIFGYTLSNPWELWGTLTLNKVKIDRYNIDTITAKITKWFQNQKRNFPDLQWLIVPEQHKDGAYHFHLLLSGLPVRELVWHKQYEKTKRDMYNWVVYEQTFGFNSFIDIRHISYQDKYKISCYLTKYITKQLCSELDKKRYWSSKGLSKPKRTNTAISNEERKTLLKVNLHDIGIISQNEYVMRDLETNKPVNIVNTTVICK
jgi:hypothetical protein